MAQNHAQELAKGQLEINCADWRSTAASLWLAGVLVGWTCGVALAWHFVLAPFVIFVSAYAGVALPDLPQFDMSSGYLLS